MSLKYARADSVHAHTRAALLPNSYLSLLLARHTLDVELQLLALKDEPIAPAALTRARRDACIQPTSVELRVDVGIEHATLLARRKLLGNRFALLGLLLLL